MVVIAGLDPAIHLLAKILAKKRWTPGSSPGVTRKDERQSHQINWENALTRVQ
jgi:hypothetical protein